MTEPTPTLHRMARAHYAAAPNFPLAGKGLNWSRWEDLPAMVVESRVKQMRAAVEVMMEPSEKLTMVGNVAARDANIPPKKTSDAGMAAAFNAMLTAILDEEEG